MSEYDAFLHPQWAQQQTNVVGYECFKCGAVVPTRSIAQHEAHHKTFGHRMETNMSSVKWCDPGNHAFKAGVDGSASFEGVNYVDGKPVSATQDVCPTHNPYNTTVDIERAITQKATEGN